MDQKRDWDRRLGLGKKKLFEVRKLYNDVTFIDEFFTLEFCIEQKFYAFGFSERSGNWEIMSREFKKVKDQLLKMLTSHGKVLTDNSRAYELGLMHKVTPSQRWGTPAGAPQKAPSAPATG